MDFWRENNNPAESDGRNKPALANAGSDPILNIGNISFGAGGSEWKFW